MLLCSRAGLVCLYQKEQVQDDMQMMTRATTIEQMLESADHLIERHRGDPAIPDRAFKPPDLPEGCILYSARCEFEGVRKRWNVELMDTTKPYDEDSIVASEHTGSLDAALREAGRMILAARSAGRG